jgi:hypothetical protein
MWGHGRVKVRSDPTIHVSRSASARSDKARLRSFFPRGALPAPSLVDGPGPIRVEGSNACMIPNVMFDGS